MAPTSLKSPQMPVIGGEGFSSPEHPGMKGVPDSNQVWSKCTKVNTLIFLITKERNTDMSNLFGLVYIAQGACFSRRNNS